MRATISHGAQIDLADPTVMCLIHSMSTPLPTQLNVIRKRGQARTSLHRCGLQPTDNHSIQLLDTAHATKAGTQAPRMRGSRACGTYDFM